MNKQRQVMFDSEVALEAHYFRRINESIDFFSTSQTHLNFTTNVKKDKCQQQQVRLRNTLNEIQLEYKGRRKKIFKKNSSPFILFIHPLLTAKENNHKI